MTQKWIKRAAQKYRGIHSPGLPFQPAAEGDIKGAAREMAIAYRENDMSIPEPIETTENSFSLYDAARMERARKQLEAGGGSFRELTED